MKYSKTILLVFASLGVAAHILVASVAAGDSVVLVQRKDPSIYYRDARHAQYSVAVLTLMTGRRRGR